MKEYKDGPPLMVRYSSHVLWKSVKFTVGGVGGGQTNTMKPQAPVSLYSKKSSLKTEKQTASLGRI